MVDSAPAKGSPDRRTPQKLNLRTKPTFRWSLGVFLLVLALIMAALHVGEHLGALTIIRTGTDDLLFGWPMAGVIALVGVGLMGLFSEADPRARRAAKNTQRKP